MSFRSTQTLVLVEDLRVEAFVGQDAPEREQTQPVSISITCTLENSEVTGDDLRNTFDYIPLLDEIREFATSRERRLIETLAEEVAAACFACEHVKTVTVSVKKPNKFPGVLAVGTERTFERE